MKKLYTFLIWEQKTEYSPVKRRAFILAKSDSVAINKAVKAGIRVVDCWKISVSHDIISALALKNNHMIIL